MSEDFAIQEVKLDESMAIFVRSLAFEKGVTCDLVVNAILLSYFWHNDVLLKDIMSGKLGERLKKEIN